MARVKGAMMARKRRNKTLKLAKGYWGAKSKHFKMANEQVMKSLTYAYVGRRLKKRDFRQLWITRISAACKINGMNYSTFMHGLKVAGIRSTARCSPRWPSTMPRRSPPCATSPRRRNCLKKHVAYAACFFPVAKGGNIWYTIRETHHRWYQEKGAFPCTARER